MTPDRFAYDSLDPAKYSNHPYIRYEDAEVRAENGVAIFSWADTGEEFLRIHETMRVEDIASIYILMNKVFQEGVDVGKDSMRATIRDNIIRSLST